MRPAEIPCCIAVLLFLSPLSVSAQSNGLPAPVDVDRISVQPHDGKVKDFYTPESLLKALPHLQRTEIGKTLAFGKVWLWQKGVIHLKGGREIPWRTFTDNVILFDTDEGPVIYTDIMSQTSDYAASKLVRTIYTWEGPKEVVIEFD